MSAPPRNRLAPDRGRGLARLVVRLLGGALPDPLAPADAQALAAVTVQVDDGGAGRNGGWDSLSPGPADRSWAERLDDLDDALEAWQKNPLVRRIVAPNPSVMTGPGAASSR